MNLKRIHYVLIGLTMLAALWLAWPDASVQSGDSAGPTASAPGNDRARPPVESRNEGPENRHRPKREGMNVGETVQTHPRIESILGDDRISVAQAAVMFHEMALDASLPVSDRLDALEHGLNLDIAPFSHFAEIPGLPAELAGEFLDEVMNHNDDPALQIRTYLALLDHSDSEVSESAADMLAFAVGDDLNEADVPTLVAMARQKLAQLAQSATTEQR